MVEPYFEEIRQNIENSRYPFDCFITGNTEKNLEIHPHWHYYIELLYSLSGCANVTLGGKSYVFSQGDFILVNSRDVHAITADPGTSVRYIVVKFDPDVLYTTGRSLFESKYILPFILAKSSQQKYFKAEEIACTSLPSLMEEILREYTSKEYAYELAVKADVYRIFLWIFRFWEKKGSAPDAGTVLKEENLKKLQNVFEYLETHYCEIVSTEWASKLCNMSYGHFCRKFKELTGKTFNEYLNYVRVIEAEKLLLTSDMNITQIALSTGFTNSSYFIKQFKHFKTLSPKAFRQFISGKENFMGQTR